MAIRILLVDDHRVVVEGLRSLLNGEKNLQVVGLAEDGRQAISMAEQLAPSVVIMDISMPSLNGIEATSQIVKNCPNSRVLALSPHVDGRHVRSMLEAGAHGYVTKEMAGSELIQAIREVSHGRKYLSSDVTESVVDGYVKKVIEDNSAMTTLGGREREVLQLLAEGLTSGEIADRLDISTNTVDTHRRNLMKKLDLHSVAELTKYAIREGLTSLEV